MDAILSWPAHRVQRLAWALLVALLAFVSVSYTMKALNNRSAFVRWREQVLAIDDANIYQRFQYPNPPIMALILRPLASVEPAVAGALVWFFLKIAMAVLSMWAVFRLVEHNGTAFPGWAKGLAILLSLRPIMGDLSHGNINIFVLFLVVAALYAWHTRWDFTAGTMLALAVCCKVTPLLFVPYFAWKRQWKLLAGWAGGMVLFLLAIPGAALGWNENLVQLESWARQMVLPFVRDGIVSSEHPNQSLPGVASRLLTHSPSFSAYPDGQYTPSEYHNVADIGRDGVRWLVRGAQGLFALLVVVLCRASTQSRGGGRIALELAVIMLGMLIFSERTWKHHCVTLALPYSAIAYAVATSAMGRRLKIGIGIAIIVALGFMLSASGMLPTRAADLAQVYGAYLWAFLILLAVLITCLVAVKAQPVVTETVAR